MITSRACSSSICAEAVLVEMAAQRRQDLVRIGADHEAQLAIGDGAGRDGVDRPVGIAGLEGQHLEAVPAEHALDRRQRLLAPVRIDLGRALAGIDMGVGQRRAHRIGQRLGPPLRHFDLAALVGDGGQRMRQDDAGVGQKAAPVAGMMAALAQGELQVEVERAARAAEDGRPAMVEARAVRADQGVGLERRLVGLAEIGQARASRSPRRSRSGWSS